MRIFLISPVRGWKNDLKQEERDAITAYVTKLERDGHTVHWPRRDTRQDGDPIGSRICEDNSAAMVIADEIHVWWHPSSEGSGFDIGMWFGIKRFLDRKLVLANPEAVEPTPRKSFRNLLLYYTGHLKYGDSRLETA